MILIIRKIICTWTMGKITFESTNVIIFNTLKVLFSSVTLDASGIVGLKGKRK